MQNKTTQAWARASNPYTIETNVTVVGYKVAIVSQGADGRARYSSLYEPSPIEYQIGRIVSEEVRPHHGGGLYVFLSRSLEETVARFAMGDLIRLDPYANRRLSFVALECRCAGPFVFYDHAGNSIRIPENPSATSLFHTTRKVAVSHLLPVRSSQPFMLESGSGAPFVDPQVERLLDPIYEPVRRRHARRETPRARRARAGETPRAAHPEPRVVGRAVGTPTGEPVRETAERRAARRRAEAEARERYEALRELRGLSVREVDELNLLFTRGASARRDR